MDALGFTANFGQECEPASLGAGLGSLPADCVLGRRSEGPVLCGALAWTSICRFWQARRGFLAGPLFPFAVHSS